MGGLNWAVELAVKTNLVKKREQQNLWVPGDWLVVGGCVREGEASVDGNGGSRCA